MKNDWSSVACTIFFVAINIVLYFIILIVVTIIMLHYVTIYYCHYYHLSLLLNTIYSTFR